jgi:hypothetical protein
MTNEPDFFLSAAGESESLASPRACWKKARLKGGGPNDHMLVYIDPPLIAQYYGLGGEDITNLVLSARHEGFSLFPIKVWPCHVYVSRILDESIIKTLTLTPHQVQIIAWGMILTASTTPTHSPDSLEYDRRRWEKLDEMRGPLENLRPSKVSVIPAYAFQREVCRFLSRATMPTSAPVR